MRRSRTAPAALGDWWVVAATGGCWRGAAAGGVRQNAPFSNGACCSRRLVGGGNDWWLLVLWSDIPQIPSFTSAHWQSCLIASGSF